MPAGHLANISAMTPATMAFQPHQPDFLPSLSSTGGMNVRQPLSNPASPSFSPVSPSNSTAFWSVGLEQQALTGASTNTGTLSLHGAIRQPSDELSHPPHISSVFGAASEAPVDADFDMIPKVPSATANNPMTRPNKRPRPNPADEILPLSHQLPRMPMPESAIWVPLSEDLSRPLPKQSDEPEPLSTPTTPVASSATSSLAQCELPTGTILSGTTISSNTVLSNIPQRRPSSSSAFIPHKHSPSLAFVKRKPAVPPSPTAATAPVTLLSTADERRRVLVSTLDAYDSRVMAQIVAMFDRERRRVQRAATAWDASQLLARQERRAQRERQTQRQRALKEEQQNIQAQQQAQGPDQTYQQPKPRPQIPEQQQQKPRQSQSQLPNVQPLPQPQPQPQPHQTQLAIRSRQDAWISLLTAVATTYKPHMGEIYFGDDIPQPASTLSRSVLGPAPAQETPENCAEWLMGLLEWSLAAVSFFFLSHLLSLLLLLVLLAHVVVAE